MKGGSLQDSSDNMHHRSGFHRFRKDWIEPIVIALIIAGFIRSYIIQPFKIPSGSMEDTLLVGDHLLAVKFLYGFKLPFIHKHYFKIRNPQPGDVIVFKYPNDPSKDYIKRCIAVGGQTVEIRNKQVYVDGLVQDNPKHVKFEKNSFITGGYEPGDNYPLTTVPERSFYAMGDNRDNSNDSRFWGFVPYENIKGKAFILYWSWDRDSSFPFKVRWSRLFRLIK